MRGIFYLTLGFIYSLTGCAHVNPAGPPPPATHAASPPTAVAPVSPKTASPVAVNPALEHQAPPAESTPSADPAKPPPTGVASKPAPAVVPTKPSTADVNKNRPSASASAPIKPPPAAVAAAPSAPAASASKPQLDFKAMEQRLRDTSAIGVFTKLSIKNQVDDLLKAFRGYHAGRVPPSLDELHQRYDGLLLKVVTLVQDDDATLASSISASRGAIWERLSNKESFQTI
jgi:hypothetical protein